MLSYETGEKIIKAIRLPSLEDFEAERKSMSKHNISDKARKYSPIPKEDVARAKSSHKKYDAYVHVQRRTKEASEREERKAMQEIWEEELKDVEKLFNLDA